MSDLDKDSEHKKLGVWASFSDEYQEICFDVWYKIGRPSGMITLRDALPETSDGRKPSHQTLSNWRTEFGWDFRADENDARALEIVNDKLVFDKSEMLKRQAEIGHQMQELGLTHIIGGFDSASAAVSAISKGVEIERSSRGLSDLIVKMSKMSDADLKKEISKLANRSENGSIIDVEKIEEKPEEKKVDTESSTEDKE